MASHNIQKSIILLVCIGGAALPGWMAYIETHQHTRIEDEINKLSVRVQEIEMSARNTSNTPSDAVLNSTRATESQQLTADRTVDFSKTLTEEAGRTPSIETFDENEIESDIKDDATVAQRVLSKFREELENDTSLRDRGESRVQTIRETLATEYNGIASVTQSDCRERICQIDIEHVDSGSMQGIVAALAMKLEWHGPHAMETKWDASTGRFHTVLYITHADVALDI